MSNYIQNKFAQFLSTARRTLTAKSDSPDDEISVNPHISELDEETYKKQLTNPILLAIKPRIPLVASAILMVLSILFFFIITKQNIWNSVSFYRTRWFSLGVISLSIGVTYIGAFWNNNMKNSLQSYIAVLHSLLLTVFSFAYLIRLNNGGLEFFRFQLRTSFVFIPLSILIFLVNYSVFAKLKHNQLLTVAQAFFIILFSYSIIGFIQVDSTFARTFSQGWLSAIFNWPAWFWLVVSSVSLTFVSGNNIQHPNIERRVLYLIGYFVVTLEILLVIYIINLNYWYQTLLALISWNFVYTNIYGMMTKKNDTKYRPRLVISIIYHIVLFLLVLYV